ncbi:hypothetical protein ABPG75_012773 [Micractinium tetrahymenae]
MSAHAAFSTGPWTADTAEPRVPASRVGGGPSGSPDSSLPLILCDEERVLATAGGAALLEALPPEAAARADAASGGVVVSLQCSSPPASFLEVAIGKLHCRRFLALARCKLYWMSPAWGASPQEVPVETQLLLFELKDGSGYGLLAPLIDKDSFRASLRPPGSGRHRRRGGPPGSLLLRLESGDESVRANSFEGVLYAAASSDPFELLDRGVTAAARLSGSAQPRWEKETPASLDVFGWCSWDAMYTGVNPRGLEEGLRHLAAGGTPARLLVIDDGWQHMDVDPQYKADADSSVLRGWAVKGPQRLAEEIGQKLAVGRLLADGDLQTVEPLRVMELLNRRASSAARQIDEAMLLDTLLRGRILTPSHPHAVRRPQPPSPSLSCPSRSGLAGARAAVLQAYDMLADLKRRAELLVAGWLKNVLEDTSSDSYRLRAFAAAAVGPLRQAILRFYAQASSHSYRLLSIKANGKFESIDTGDEAPLNSSTDNFGQVVRELKKRCNLQYVYCWHAMMGYWSGIMPGAPGVARYEPRLMYPRPSPGTLEVDPSMQWVHPAVNGVSIAKDPRLLHSDLHAYLAECGMDGVKVDVQSTITMFGYHEGGYAAMGAKWHRSLEDSTARHLPGNHQINSMCCAIEDIYNMTHSNICRVGEDFYPALPASHTAHIANAAFNSLMTAAIAFPDWDMFHSDHGSSHLHAAARAVSGGLVYVSDRVGEHDFSLLRRLVLPDGSVLRCRQPGRPTADCLFVDVSRDCQSVLKIWNLNSVTGLVGLFNVQGSTWAVRRRNYHTHDQHPPTLAAEVHPRDVPYLPAAERYAVWSDKLTELRILEGRDDFWRLSVRGGGGHDLITISPVLQSLGYKPGSSGRSSGGHGTAAAGVAVAPIGLVNMMNAGGAVLAAELAEPEANGGHANGSEPAGPELRILLRGAGRFLLYASRPPAAVLLDGQPAGGVEWEERSGALFFAVPWREPEPGEGAGGRRTVVVRF